MWLPALCRLSYGRQGETEGELDGYFGASEQRGGCFLEPPLWIVL